ncbi:MAG: hypothetical protein QGG40_09320 [Myxococcota bacterium]|nr:hypothetical protein [Myxococcota bacterium]
MVLELRAKRKSGVAFLGVILAMGSSPAQAQDCPELVTLVQGISTAVQEVRLDDAAAIAREGQAALSCQSKVVVPQVMAAFFQYAGAVDMYLGDQAAAVRSFEWAAVVSPAGSFDTMLGEEAAALYGEVHSRVYSEAGGQLKVDGPSEMWIDGASQPSGVPHTLTPGPHMLQWKGADGQLNSREVRLVSGESQNMTLGPVAVEPEPVVEEVVTAKGGGMSSSTLLVAGGGAAVVTGGVLYLSAGKMYEDFLDSEDPASLEDQRSQVNGRVMASAATAVVGATLISASFAVATSTALTWSW